MSPAPLDPMSGGQPQGLLRFLTCGSVDDGKSTLIGRLLHDARLLFDDQLEALEADSKRAATTGGALDFALLLDGLVAEREQGITIDVAYRYFATDRRRFIVADAPGHEEYTRNMVTAASVSDLAVVLVDARQGVLVQTRRHVHILALLGVRHVVLAVNKMDLVGFDQARFEEITLAFSAFSVPFHLASIVAIPVSARFGDNVAARSDRAPWYVGPSLLGYLENVAAEADLSAAPFRYPVQWVNRDDASFRGYAGTVASGVIRAGDPVVVTRTGQTANVDRIVTFDGDLSVASPGTRDADSRAGCRHQPWRPAVWSGSTAAGFGRPGCASDLAE